MRDARELLEGLRQLMVDRAEAGWKWAAESGRATVDRARYRARADAFDEVAADIERVLDRGEVVDVFGAEVVRRSEIRLRLPDTPTMRSLLRDLAIFAVEDEAEAVDVTAERAGACEEFDRVVTAALEA